MNVFPKFLQICLKNVYMVNFIPTNFLYKAVSFSEDIYFIKDIYVA